MEPSRQGRPRNHFSVAPRPPFKRKSDPPRIPVHKRLRHNSDVLDSTIMVKNLDYSTSSDQLRDYFQNYGDVSQVRMVPDQGYGLVTFDAKEIAQGVIVAGNDKEGIRMGNSQRKVQISWAASGFSTNTEAGNKKHQRKAESKRIRRSHGLPRRCKSRLFISAFASAVASTNPEVATRPKKPVEVSLLDFPNREVIAYDDWL